MDWKIGFYRRYFADISNIGWPWKDIEHWLSDGRNIGKISGKPKYRFGTDKTEEAYQNIGDISAIYRIYRRYIGYIGEYIGYIGEYIGYIGEYIGYIGKYIGYIADISGNIGDFF